MGRRNRANRNKEKKNTQIALNTQEVNRVISSEVIMCAKEKFLKTLQNIYSLYLENFTKSLGSKRKITKKALGVAESFLNLQSYECYHNFDDSQEFQHIFYAQLNRFLSILLQHLRDLEMHDKKYIFDCIIESYKLLESVGKDIDKVAYFLFIKTGFDCMSMLRLIFHEKIIKDRFIQNILKEGSFYKEGGDNLYQITEFGENAKESINESNISNGKKKKKKKKKIENIEKNEEIDLEVQEFEKRLATAEIVVIKSRPNVSDVWIGGLKKQLNNLKVLCF
ncbi:hypothetical protein SteCoe_28123 [Stentor coeruleus]|uniref:Uncharacterized protein n=1 Tax=Stentor coeruleus TaxID=5963 RepID=A0A1R2B901_9CILI|nr:hypothetical protein SteCoe_28123 [Stentor coeruleus]